MRCILNAALILLSVCIVLLSAKPVMESESKFRYSDNSHDFTTIRKMYDPKTKRAWIESDDGNIKGRSDIEKFTRKKRMRSQRGVLSEKLNDRLSKMKYNDTLKIEGYIPWPKSKCLNRTKYSIEQLRKHSRKTALYEQHYFQHKRNKIKRKHNISFDNDDEGNGSHFIATLKKEKINQLYSDEDIGFIEEYTKRQRKPAGSCADHIDDNGIGSLDFSSLAYSAYNPEPTMTTFGYFGQGINSATVESESPKASFIQCLKDRGTLVGDCKTNYDDHSAWTLECLSQTAPQAKLFHETTVFSNTFPYWLDDKDITTLSISQHGATGVASYDNIILDRMAYKYPYTTFCLAAGNPGYCHPVHNVAYNALNVGNVRHTNESHYEMMGLDRGCENGEYEDQEFGLDPISTAKNPPAVHGYNNSQLEVTCGSCFNGYGGDRELPHIVAPGYSPYDCGLSTDCIQEAYGKGGGSAGTSFSAPVANGIAACVQSANSSAFKYSPELTRAALILTAQNVYGGYWNQWTDGIDGTGVISGSEAVSFALNASECYPDQPEAISEGYYGSSIGENTGSGYDISFKVQVPSVLPQNKHLRVVLTWSSSPSNNLFGTVNEIADLDIVTPGIICPVTNTNNWGTWDSNVEVAEIENSQLLPNSQITVNVRVWYFTIPDEAINKDMGIIYYGIVWAWVIDHAV